MNKMITLAFAMTIFTSVSAEYNQDWWKSLVLDLTSTNDLANAASVLCQQEESLSLLYGVDYCAADAIAATNLWNMLAVLHGDLREKKMPCIPKVYRNFGLITDDDELQRRRAKNAAAAEMRSYQLALYAVEERIEAVFAKASKSEALYTFLISERNTIVSNLVAKSHLTQQEAMSLGLTNIVETASE